MPIKWDLAAAAFGDLLEKIKVYSKNGACILIQGESGTGKELAARIIHELSDVSKGAFTPVNCSSIPNELLESKFFGHKKGAFTGADKDQKGLFEMADKGTLFLDEIGDMSLDLQPKLLRAIQFQSFYPVGANEEVKVEARIVAATNCSLEELIAQNKFRSDLFYRLNVISINLKPLREKRQDIPTLLALFFKTYEQKYKLNQPLQVCDETYEKLVSYDWPGNIRELENIVHRIVIFCTNSQSNKFTIESLTAIAKEIFTGNQKEENKLDLLKNPNDLNKTLNEIEKSLLIEALNQNNWNKSRASKSLNIKRTTLIQKIKKFKLEKQDQGNLLELLDSDIS